MVLKFARYHAPRLLKFGGVGVVNVLVDFGVYSFAYWWFTTAYGLGELRAAGPANGLGWLFAVTTSYVLNSYFTFRHNGEHAPLRLRSYLRFVGAGLAGLATSTIILLFALDFLREQLPEVLATLSLPTDLARFAPHIAKLIAIGLAFWVNYAASYMLVFRPLAKEADEDEAAKEPRIG